VVHQPIIEGKRGICGKIDVEKFVTRQAAPAYMIKRYRLRTVKILQVEIRATQQFGEKFEFCNAIAVEVSDPGHRLARERVQIVVGYVAAIPIEPVLIRAVRRHAVGALQTERFGHVFGGHRERLEHDLILAPSQKFEIYYNLHIG